MWGENREKECERKGKGGEILNILRDSQTPLRYTYTHACLLPSSVTLTAVHSQIDLG